MIIATLAGLALATNTPTLRPELAPLDFLVGHCWRGTFASGEVDTHCFEPVFGGQHVRDRHEVTGGERPYSGETIFSWDAAARAVAFTYWNTSGGISRGTMRLEGGRLVFGDETYRGPDGREMRISTHWQPIGESAYESVSRSDTAAMNRTVRFERVAETIAISTSRDAEGRQTLVHESVIAAPPPQVWEAVSTAAGWASWAVPVAWWDGDLLETSYTSTAARGDRSTIQQQIAARIPERLLVFRTTKAPDGFPHFDAFREVTHAIALEPAGEGRTRVTLTSSGYPDNEAGRQLLGFFRDGNRITLERLSRRFAEGPIDWAREQRSAQR